MKKIILVSSLILSIAGCATRPVSTAESKPVSMANILDSRFLVNSPGSGTVVIKRDSGVFGSACTSRVFVNAKPTADLAPIEKLVLYLPPGDYIFSAWPNGICGGGMSEVRANVKSSETLTFRIGMGSNGEFLINPTAF
jgi:hypothetical protein